MCHNWSNSQKTCGAVGSATDEHAPWLWAPAELSDDNSTDMNMNNKCNNKTNNQHHHDNGKLPALAMNHRDTEPPFSLSLQTHRKVMLMRSWASCSRKAHTLIGLYTLAAFCCFLIAGLASGMSDGLPRVALGHKVQTVPLHTALATKAGGSGHAFVSEMESRGESADRGAGLQSLWTSMVKMSPLQRSVSTMLPVTGS